MQLTLLALASALGFASNNVLVHRASLRGDPTQGVLLSILIGPPYWASFFVLVAGIAGQLDQIGHLALG